MAREFSRTQRVADQIQKELAQLIQRELKDPRLGLVTVSSVSVSKDLTHANVYVTVLSADELAGDESVVKDTLKILNGAAGFLRGELGHRIRLRVTPALRFHFDTSIGRGRRVSSLIEKAIQSDSSESDD